MYRKTPHAALHLGVGVKRLLAAIRCRRLLPPSKDSSGHFIWTSKDLNRARVALRIDRRRRGQKGVAYAR
jgi:hypothetical protein